MGSSKKPAKVYFNAELFDFFLKAMDMSRRFLFDKIGIKRSGNFANEGVSPDFCKRVLDYCRGRITLNDGACVGDFSFRGFMDKTEQAEPLFYVRFEKAMGFREGIIRHILLTRSFLGMDQVEFSKVMGMSRNQLSSLESGNFRHLNVDHMDRLAEIKRERGLDDWL